MTPQYPNQLHIDLDGELSAVVAALEIPSIDMRNWGAQLRFSATRKKTEHFYLEIKPHLQPFTLYGSGDFHHLSALWLRQIQEPFILLSFDNHPDWDIRPPRWCCGGWINRALELNQLKAAQVWGCGNFELNWPHHLFAPRKALKTKRLQVFAWQERYPNLAICQQESITRDTWRTTFLQQLAGWQGHHIYITIDLDCLDSTEFFSNWEHGLFTVEDLAWAITQVREHAILIGGDMCGAYSDPSYSRWTQQLISTLDHPKLPNISPAEAAHNNHKAITRLWPLLTHPNNQ